jgi:hypothetical protein
MSSRTAVLLSAVVLAALTRWLPHPANFAPITAMAVFATARLADRWLLIRDSRSPLPIAGTLLTGSCLFFVLSNLGFWATSGFYPRTMEGLTACFTAAIPFFQNTVMGDAMYGLILFGGFALAEARFPALRPVERQPA